MSTSPSLSENPGSFLRRVQGPAGDELHALARPSDTTADAAAQAASAYDVLLRVLDAGGAGPAHLVTENVFLSPVVDAGVFRERRERALGAAAASPATTIIGQAPLEQDGSRPPALVEIAAFAFVPRDRGASASHVAIPSPCSCAACARGHRARLTPVGTQVHFHAGNVLGRGDDPESEALDVFVEAERLLAAAGMDFRDVVRTWIHLRDIDRDYAALNRARRDFFTSRGIERRPASTGVQGIPFAAGHDFSLSLFAVKSPHPLDAPLLSTPSLNEAWSYGADFSRGVRLDDDNKVALIVSGTASIDDRGASVHEGDLAAQAARMLHNIETLLAGQGATFADLVSAVTYVKFPSDAAALRRELEAGGFGGFPLAVVESPLCRPELLCETEAVAVLPLPPKA